MFARGISILISSAVDPGNIPSPRPSDVLEERCAQEAMRALAAEPEYMPLSARLKDADKYARMRRKRRARLEAFLWIEPNPDAVSRMLDLILDICEENSWAAGSDYDDPARPEIDVQAAETGVLLAWILRRHGQRLAERSPRIHSLALGEVRRRLLSPILVHEDYPFMGGNGSCPGLILCDLLLCCLLTEKNPSRRQQPVKMLLRLLDRLCATRPNPLAPIEERIADACAVADLARLVKRLTRGEFDLTRSVPPENWLDDILISWIHGDYFANPAGKHLRPDLAGMDLFRLGYLAQDRALCALGVQIGRLTEHSAFSLSGRVLSMEYMRAAQDESANPPRLRRAAADNGALMVSRVDSLFAAITGAGLRANTGDVYLFCDSSPILADPGGMLHSLPLVNGLAPQTCPRQLPPTDADFGPERDLMSVDMTSVYPERAMLSAYQRTLMTLRTDGTVRLVDAFEFIRAPKELHFRFVTPQRPMPLRDGLRLGPVLLSWDGDMVPDISEMPESEIFPGGCWLVDFLMTDVPNRMICGFTFEKMN